MAKSFGAKLRVIRDQRGLTLDEMAALLGTSKQVLSRYENAQRTPKLDTVQEYAKKLSVPVLYLVDDSIDTLPDGDGQWAAPDQFADDDQSVTFGVIGAIAAGYDREPQYDYTGETQVFPRSVLRGRPKDDFFCLRVQGRSMEPLFFDGDSVLVLRCEAVDQNTVAVVLYNGDEATLKRVRYAPNWLEMIPVNPEYQVRRIEGAQLEQCRILGRAMSLSREL